MTDIDSPQARRTAMAVAYAVTFIAFLDTFALLPTIGPYAEALGASGLGMGLALGAYSVTNLMFNVVGGVMLDRAGRRRLAILGFTLVVLAILAYPLANSVSTLIMVRLLHGIGGGILIPAVYTLIGDMAATGKKGRAMGRVGAAIGAAAVIAPGIAGTARGRFGFEAVFIGLAAVMAVGLVITFAAVRETAGRSVTAQARTTSMRSLLASPDLQVAYIATFGFTFGFGALGAFLPSRIEATGAGPAVSGGLFTLLSLIAAVLMLTRVAGRVDDQGPRRPILIGLPAVAVGLVVIGLGDAVGMMAVGVALFGVGFGIVYPAASGATAIAAAASGRGRAFGLFNVAYSLGFVIGPPLSGYLSDRFGASPFLTAAVVCAAATVIIGGRRHSLP
jgi:MFS transporter, DHA1 family, multidrug resistance protein